MSPPPQEIAIADPHDPGPEAPGEAAPDQGAEEGAPAPGASDPGASPGPDAQAEAEIHAEALAEAEALASALSRQGGGDTFEFLLAGGRGFILDFEQGRDVINLEGLGLTPWDLLPSIRGRDLVLSFEGGEVVLNGAAGVHLTQWDFRY